MKHLDEQYIKEIYQLIKSLLTFCKYELTINKGEINLNCSVKDLTKILLFLISIVLKTVSRPAVAEEVATEKLEFCILFTRFSSFLQKVWLVKKASSITPSISS